MHNAPAQPKSGNKTLLIILLVIGIPCLALVVLGVVGAFSCFRLMQGTIMPMVSCGIAYEEVREAMIQYSKDHDGKLPNAATWEDDLRTYYQKVDLIKNHQDKDLPKGFLPEKMPINGPWGCKIGEKKYTGMAFNKALSGMKLADIKDPASTVLVFEVTQTGKNLSQVYAPRSKADAPKLFGESRDWMYINVEGASPFKGGKFGETPMPPARVEPGK